jgi:PPOX class probable F420-dependent enzyme
LRVVAALTEQAYELLHGKNFAHVAVIRPDGSPHVTITWIDAADGHVLVNTSIGRVKDRYVRRDPRITITVHEEGNGYRWLRVDGIVAEFVTGDEADRHIDFLNRKYNDGRPWTFVTNQRRVIYRVRPERLFVRED